MYNVSQMKECFQDSLKSAGPLSNLITSYPAVWSSYFLPDFFIPPLAAKRNNTAG